MKMQLNQKNVFKYPFLSLFIYALFYLIRKIFLVAALIMFYSLHSIFIYFRFQLVEIGKSFSIQLSIQLIINIERKFLAKN